MTVAVGQDDLLGVTVDKVLAAIRAARPDALEPA